MVIRLITDEFDRRTLKTATQAEGQDEALTADATKKKKSKKDIECFNCKKRGHMKSDCWAKGGGKEGQGPKRKGQDGAASADQQGQQQPDIEAWAAIEEVSEEEAKSVQFRKRDTHRERALRLWAPHATCPHSANNSSPIARYHRAPSWQRTNASSSQRDGGLAHPST
jgi:hypothetical protein